METETKFAWFENTDKDQFEVHAPNCGCIKKYISQMIIDSSNVHSITASTPSKAKEQLVDQYTYDDGDEQVSVTVKVFPCTKNQ
jgi:hypothetical protein